MFRGWLRIPERGFQKRGVPASKTGAFRIPDGGSSEQQRGSQNVTATVAVMFPPIGAGCVVFIFLLAAGSMIASKSTHGFEACACCVSVMFMLAFGRQLEPKEHRLHNSSRTRAYCYAKSLHSTPMPERARRQSQRVIRCSSRRHACVIVFKDPAARAPNQRKRNITP